MKHRLDIKTMDAARGVDIMRCHRKGRTHNTMTGTISARGIFTPSPHSHHFVTHKSTTDPFYLNHVSWGKCSWVGSFTSACPDISAPPAAHSQAFKCTVIPNQPWIKLSHGCLDKPDDESQLYCRGLAHTGVLIYEGLMSHLSWMTHPMKTGNGSSLDL